MVNLINMEEEKIKDIITNFKSKSNGDLKEVLTVLSKDFEDTKTMLVKLTHHLDSTESLYNNILKEYKKRGN